VDIAETCNVHPHFKKGRCREVEIAKVPARGAQDSTPTKNWGKYECFARRLS
jgi:hypothetical protein